MRSRRERYSANAPVSRLSLSAADHSAISAARPTPSDVMPSPSTKKAESAMLVRFRNSCTTKASLARDWPMNQPMTQ